MGETVELNAYRCQNHLCKGGTLYYPNGHTVPCKACAGTGKESERVNRSLGEPVLQTPEKN